MRDKEALISHAKKLINGQNIDSILNGLLNPLNNQEETQIAVYVDIYDPTPEIMQEEPSSIPIIADSMGLW